MHSIEAEFSQSSILGMISLLWILWGASKGKKRISVITTFICIKCGREINSKAKRDSITLLMNIIFDQIDIFALHNN